MRQILLKTGTKNSLKIFQINIKLAKTRYGSKQTTLSKIGRSGGLPLNRFAVDGPSSSRKKKDYSGEDELIQFDEGLYNIDLPHLVISNLLFDDSSTIYSSSSLHVSSSAGNIPRSIDQTISGVNNNPNSTTL
ncbi:hypothetical protein ACTFIW_000016 [Dictyostelium discoideum]